MKQKNLTLYLCRGSVIAALYIVLTYISALFGLSSGVIQLRISEALCILPIFLPEAVPALFIGCLLSNVLTGAVLFDVIFGSLATLIGALGARIWIKLPERLRFLASVPTIISNSLIIPPVLIFAYGATDAYWFILLTVFLGEFISAGVFGGILYSVFKRYKLDKRFL